MDKEFKPSNYIVEDIDNGPVKLEKKMKNSNNMSVLRGSAEKVMDDSERGERTHSMVVGDDVADILLKGSDIDQPRESTTINI